jgi:hypothetical protein
MIDVLKLSRQAQGLSRICVWSHLTLSHPAVATAKHRLYSCRPTGLIRICTAVKM